MKTGLRIVKLRSGRYTAIKKGLFGWKTLIETFYNDGPFHLHKGYSFSYFFGRNISTTDSIISTLNQLRSFHEERDWIKGIKIAEQKEKDRRKNEKTKHLNT